MSALLNIENLSITFPSNDGPTEVVHGFDLSLQAGQVIGIVGESGSGKSVSVLSITKLISNAKLSAQRVTYTPTGGNEINLLKADDVTLEQIRGQEIAYIFQEPMTALHPLFTCGQQVVEALQRHSKADHTTAKKKTIALFEEMQLPEPANMFKRYPHQLSGGQRQRVMIAMALSNDPAILIADEPTTALDSVLQKALTKHMVDSCKKRNTGLILISHDLQLIQDFTDEVIVMYQGNIIETGKTSDVVRAPKSIYTQSLLQCQPNFSKKSTVLPTIYELADYEDGKFKVKPFTDQRFTFQPISDDPYIQVQQISKFFGKGDAKVQALTDVSFDIYKGETLGLIGESGCGKSTLSKIIIQLLEADSGSLLFQGKPANRDRKTFAKKVQMIFQDPYASLNPAMQVGDIIAEPIIVHKLAKGKKEVIAKVEALLEEVGLQAKDYNKYPHEFSGGQRQRISIARALAVEPDLIICDESVSALDISVQAQILNLFNQLKVNRQLTYLFISHDLNVVSYICDRIVVMQEG
ncbi:MAG: peptide/nickel transport system ATP-binding protein, partial [Bacteroidia bacterium]